MMHELSTLGETVMHNEAAGAPQQQHFADGSLDAMTALVRGSLLQMANGTVLAVDEADPIARQADGSVAIRLVTTPGGPAYQLPLSAARISVTAVLPGAAWPGVEHASVMGGAALTLRLAFQANADVATMQVTVAGLAQDQEVDSTQLAAWLGRRWAPATTTKPQVDQALAGQLVQLRGTQVAQRLHARGCPPDAELLGPGHADRPGGQLASPPLGERGVRPDRGELRQEPRDLGVWVAAGAPGTAGLPHAERADVRRRAGARFRQAQYGAGQRRTERPGGHAAARKPDAGATLFMTMSLLMSMSMNTCNQRLFIS